MKTSVKAIKNSTPEGLASDLNTFLHTTPGNVKDIKYLESTTTQVSAIRGGMTNKLFIAFVQYEHQ